MTTERTLTPDNTDQKDQTLRPDTPLTQSVSLSQSVESTARTGGITADSGQVAEDSFHDSSPFLTPAAPREMIDKILVKQALLRCD